MDIAKLPVDLRKRVTAEIAPGERVLYAATPSRRAGLLPALGVFLFGVGWSSIAFTFFFVSIAMAVGLGPAGVISPEPLSWMAIAFALFSLPFVAVGLVCLSAPFYIVHRNGHLAHVISDRRVLNVYSGRYSGAESYALDRIMSLTRTDWKNGRGTLSIGYGFDKDSDGDARALSVDFGGVADVRRAESALRSVAPGMQRKD